MLKSERILNFTLLMFTRVTGQMYFQCFMKTLKSVQYLN